MQHLPALEISSPRAVLQLHPQPCTELEVHRNCRRMSASPKMLQHKIPQAAEGKVRLLGEASQGGASRTNPQAV